MTDQAPDATTEPTTPSMKVVLEESEDFAPRARKSTTDALVAFRPVLTQISSNPERTGKVFTIARGVTPTKASALVGLLNEHYPSEWTFAARSTTDAPNDAIVQAKYDPANPRKVRKLNRKPVDPNAPKRERKAKS